MVAAAQQRLNMVDAQVRANDVTDPRIHAAMRDVPRERFVPASRQALAYADASVEVAPGRFLLDPRTFAKLVQLAAIQSLDSILDVGCATGYSSAVLARLGRIVTALDQDADLVRVAVEALAGAANVTVVQGRLLDGFKGRAPYNVIFVNGAIDSLPDTLSQQLAEGGRLVALERQDALGRARLYVRQHGKLGSRPDFDAVAPLLPGFRATPGFVF